MNLLGLDIGTQGVRVAILSAQGAIQAQQTHDFGTTATIPDLPTGWFEQRPDIWLNAIERCFHALANDSDGKIALAKTHAIAVTSTSGTLLAVDHHGTPLMPAIMYNDGRATQEAEQTQAAGADVANRLGYRFGNSYTLPKVLWLQHHRPELYAQAAWFISPTDFVIGWLSGCVGVSDPTNMFKMGYDIARNCWPDYMEQLALELVRFPQVVASGTSVGTVRPELATKYGMAADTMVCAGMTDGCACQVAAGALAPGQWCSTIGTTLIIKGVSETLIPDPLGRVYSHRHPDGYWLPGGAGNVGAGILQKRYGDRVPTLCQEANRHTPTGFSAYPLAGIGERFPFVTPHATAFMLDADGQPMPATSELAPAVDVAIALEGVAYVERLAYETLLDLGFKIGDTILTVGGGSHSTTWLQIRADIMGRRVKRPAAPIGAVGAAVIAASRTVFSSLQEAGNAMIHADVSIDPGINRGRYDDAYHRFRDELVARGWLTA